MGDWQLGPKPESAVELTTPFVATGIAIIERLPRGVNCGKGKPRLADYCTNFDPKLEPLAIKRVTLRLFELGSP